MSKTLKMIAVLAGLFMIATAQPALAQSGSMGSVDISECPQYDPPTISVVQMTGLTYQSQTKTAFQIAREKAVRYGQKMPQEQGNLGISGLRAETQLNVEAYSEIGCIVVHDIDVKIYLDNKMEFATDYQPGTCMYGEFFNLEMELMQQDEEIVNNEVMELRHVLREDIGANYVFGPIRGVNLDEAKAEKTAEIEEVINNRVTELEKKINKIRRESDIPAYHDEIKKDCAGGHLKKTK